MTELNFDALLIDQVSQTLKDIGDAFKAVGDAAVSMASTIDTAFKSLDQVMTDFDDFVGGIGKTFADQSPEILAFRDDLDAVAEGVDTLVTGSRDIISITGLTADSLKDETSQLSFLFTALDEVGKVKTETAADEAALKDSTDQAVVSLKAEAVALASVKVNMEEESAAGKDSAGGRSGGYGAVLGATMLLGMAGAAVRLGVDIVKSGMDGETALNKVLALADTDQSHFAQYKDTIIAWTSEYGQSISSMAGGLYDITSVGYQSADALNILKYSAEAAAAGGTDLHTVTNGLTSIMKAYNISAADASHATDILVTGVRLGKAPFDEYSRAIGLVGVASKEANIGIDQSSAALSTLTQVWPSVRQAGQNLQNMIQTVAIKTDDLAKRADKLGLSFNETKYSSMSLQDKLEYLWQISGKNQQEFGKLIGNATATKAAFYLAVEGADGYSSALKAMADSSGATDSAFQTHQQTMQAHIDDLKGAFSSLAMTISDAVAPMINGALEHITNVFSAFTTFVENHGAQVQQIIIVLAGIIGGMFVGAVVALNIALKGVMGDAALFGSIFSAAGFVISILALKFKDAYDHSKPFRDAVNQLMGALKTLADTILSAVKPVLDALGQAFKSIWDFVSGLLGPLLHVKDAMDPVAQGFEHAHRAVGNACVDIQNTKGALDVVKTPLDIVTGLIKGLADGAKTLAGWIQTLTDKWLPHAHSVETVETHMEKIHGHMVKVTDVVSRMEPGVNNLSIAFSHVGDFLKKVFDTVTSLIGPIGGLAGIVGVAAIAHSHWVEWGGKLIFSLFRVAGILTDLQGVIIKFGAQAILTFVSIQDVAKIDGVFGAVKFVIGLVSASFWEMAAAGWAAIAPWLPFIAIGALVVGAIVAVVVAFKHFWDTNAGFRVFIGNLLGQLKEFAGFLLGQLKSVWDMLVGVFKQNVLPAIQQLQAAFNEIKPFLIAVGAIIGAVLIANLGLLIGWLKGLAYLVAQVVGGAFKILGGAIEVVAGIIRFFAAFIGGIVSLIVDLFTGHFDKLGPDLIKMFQGMVSGIGSILHGLLGMIVGLIQGLPGAVFGALGNFIGGVIGFFEHLFDHLVGHSVVPDLINGIISWFLGLPVQVLQTVEKLVVTVIGFFLQLPLKILLSLADLEVHAVGFFLDMGQKILGALKNIPIIGFFANIASGAITQVQGMVKGVGGLLDNLVNNTKNKEEQAKVQAQIQQEQAKINAIASKETEVREVIAKEDQKRRQLIQEAEQTHDPIKRMQLMHEAAIIASHERMAQQTLQKMEYQKVEAIKKKAAEKAELERLQEEAKKNILQKLGDMVMQGLGKLGEMATGAISKVTDFIGNIVSGLVGGIVNVANAMTQIRDKILGVLGSFGQDLLNAGGNIVKSIADGITHGIPNAIGNAMGGIGNFIKDHLPFSPAKVGPMKDIMTWGPNITRSIGIGIEAGIPTLSDPLTKVGQTIQKGILGGAGMDASGGAPRNVPVLGSGSLAGGSAQAGTAIKEFHFHLDGGLGAGLQLLNPAERSRFVRQVSDEMGRQMQMQGRVSVGYSGN